MQVNADIDRDYSVEELNDLIKLIKEVDNMATADSIASTLGYNAGYVSQVKSRKAIPRKFYKAVKSHYESLRNAKPKEEVKELPKDPNPAELIVSNRILIEANKALIDAHHIVCRNNEDLMQIAKSVFNWRTPSLTDSEPQAEGGTVAKAADELEQTGRTGPFFRPKSNKKSDS